MHIADWEHNVVECTHVRVLHSDVIKDFVFEDKAKDMGPKDEDKDLKNSKPWTRTRMRT